MIRYEYIDSSVSGDDIHPDSIFQNEMKMAWEFVSDLKITDEIDSCPVCGNIREELLFKKWGCRYAVCPNCWSLSLSMLPSEEIFKDYFHRSGLAKFRASKGYQKLVSGKRKEVWDSQIEWVGGRISRYRGNKKYTIIDWGCKAVGWIEKHSRAAYVGEYALMDPLPPINSTDNSEVQADIVCLMDILQREIDPVRLFRRIYKHLYPGGLVFITCRAGTGFDVLTLREGSDSVFPLDHMILPSPEGLQILLEQTGFDVLETTTPGLLDMNYVKQSEQDIPNDQYFARYIMNRKDSLLLERMQGFLQRNNLSSHLRCVAMRK